MKVVSASAFFSVPEPRLSTLLEIKGYEVFRVDRVEIKDAQKLDEQKNKQIKDAVDAQLVKKKLTKTDADTADLYIGYQVGAGAGKQLISYKTDWGFGPGWFKEGFFGDRYGNGMLAPSTISAGQLAMDMYDPKNHYLVWRGVVSKTFDQSAAPEEQEKRLLKSVAKLLKSGNSGFIVGEKARNESPISFLS